MLRRFSFVLFAFSLAGCSNSLSNVRSEHATGGGTARIYEASAAKAYEASVGILRREGVEAIEEHQADGYMLGHKEGQALPPRYGAYIGVWVESSGPDHSKVTVVTKREHPADFATGLTEGTFHDELTQALASAPAIASSAPDGGAQ
jgi:hypothetical protein